MDEVAKDRELGLPSRVSVALPPPPPPQMTNNWKDADNVANNSLKEESMSSTKRRMFYVELKPEQTTIVSWKKLLKEDEMKNQKSVSSIVTADVMAGSGSGPVAAAAVQPVESKHEAHSVNRFNAVIEKIERLYMGEHSSDEELGENIYDDHYDTKDSFIDDAELDEYFKVDKLSTKHSGYFVNKGKLEGTESSSLSNLAPEKSRRKDSADSGIETQSVHIKKDPSGMVKVAARKVPLSGKKLQNTPKTGTTYGEYHKKQKIMENKQNVSSGFHMKKILDSSTNVENISHVKTSKVVSHKAELTQNSNVANGSFNILHHASAKKDRFDSQFNKLLNNKKESEKVPQNEKLHIDYTRPMQAVQPSCAAMDGSATLPKGNALERAIHDLGKSVALCLPLKDGIKYISPESQQIAKRRLPQDVKLKLAKVARLSVNQKKISEEALIDRLMGIVGHITERTTLKKNMKDMAELYLSGKQEKMDKFEKTKKEVNGMIKAQVKYKADQDASADDFQDDGQGNYNAMDNALEDKICELYDLYAERNRMDSDMDFQPKKVHAKLAELWAEDHVDSNAIKNAISRSKARKRAQFLRNKVREEDKMKVRKAMPGKETNPEQQPQQPMQQKSHPTSKLDEKTLVISNASKMKTAAEELKRKMKRKSEIDLNKIHPRPAKLSHPPPRKRSDGNEVQNNVYDPDPVAKPNVQLPSLISEQNC